MENAISLSAHLNASVFDPQHSPIAVAKFSPAPATLMDNINAFCKTVENEVRIEVLNELANGKSLPMHMAVTVDCNGALLPFHKRFNSQNDDAIEIAARLLAHEIAGKLPHIIISLPEFRNQQKRGVVL